MGWAVSGERSCTLGGEGQMQRFNGVYIRTPPSILGPRGNPTHKPARVHLLRRHAQARSQPLQNHGKRVGLAHVRRPAHHARLFRRAVLERHVQVVDGEDGVLGAVDQERGRAAAAVERAVFDEAEP